MTNIEYVEQLAAYAERVKESEFFETHPEFLGRLCHFCYDKEKAVSLLKALGGKWTKRNSTSDTEYAQIYLESVQFPVTILVPRDKVCRRTVTWDCEPLLSPEDEAEVQEAMAGQA